MQDNLTFEQLGLSASLLEAITDMGFTQPSAIQAAAIPVMLGGKDLIGQAQTGTGKTAAFGAPVIQLTDPEERFPQAIILCPTRELAVQVAEELKKLSKHVRGLHICAVYGGESIDKQIKALQKGAQIIVGTPGRVMDHMDRGTLRLERISMVVLDEADEMLDMGFREDIEQILESVPEERQTVLFSATMPPPILSITKRFQKNPEMIKIASKAVTVSAITQYYFDVKGSLKLELMVRLIDGYQLSQILVFCNTKSMTDELTEKMIEKGFDAEALHGDLRQNQRSMVLNSFKKGRGSILVATDVAARGIDVDNVEAVFNYDMPNNAETYVHRIGRTGRAGKSGLAFTFCSNRDNLRTLDDIRKYTKAEITEGEIPGKDQLMIIKKKKIKEQIQETLDAADIAGFREIAEDLLKDETLSADLVLAGLLKLQFGPLPTDDTVFLFAAPKRRSDDRPERSDRGSRFERDRPSRDYDRRGSDRRGNDRNSFSQRDQPRSRSRQGDDAPSGRSEREFGRPKPARGSGEKMSRIFINLGKSARIKPGDLVGAIAGETGLAGDRIGHIEIFDHFSFVEVPQSMAREISETMSQVSIKGKTVHSEVARS